MTDVFVHAHVDIYIDYTQLYNHYKPIFLEVGFLNKAQSPENETDSFHRD